MRRIPDPMLPTWWLASVLAAGVSSLLLATGLRAGEAPVLSPAAGKELYLKNCAPCHGPDGSARSPAARKLGVRDLRPSTLPDDQIARQIRSGVSDAAGKPKMPAFGDKLSGAEIEALTRMVKSFRKPATAAP
jgi:mono/diheme cytochrome c family protein